MTLREDIETYVHMLNELSDRERGYSPCNDYEEGYCRGTSDTFEAVIDSLIDLLAEYPTKDGSTT